MNFLPRICLFLTLLIACLATPAYSQDFGGADTGGYSDDGGAYIHRSNYPQGMQAFGVQVYINKIPKGKAVKVGATIHRPDGTLSITLVPTSTPISDDDGYSTYVYLEVFPNQVGAVDFDQIGNWTVDVTFDGVSVGHQSFVVETLKIKVISARMVSNHVLQVKTSRKFSGHTYKVRISTANSQATTVDYQNLMSDVDAGGTVNDTSPVNIDLQAQGVPRFSKNEIFTVEAAVYADGGDSVTDEKQAVILLPIVVVPGIDPGPFGGESFGGDGTFHDLEANFKVYSKNKLLTGNLLGDGYSLVGDQTNAELSYPTLYTVSYNRNNSTFAQGADAISNLVASTIKQKTYADAINLVGHSKGCLVSRQYLATSSQPAKVNKLIMCQGPHLGSLWALLGINFGYNFRNLYPLWPCLQSVTLKKTTPFIFPPLPMYNTELNDLNGQQLPLDTKYEIIYSTSVKNTPYTKSIHTSSSQSGTAVNPIDGDLIVPAFSQLGIARNPNVLIGPFPLIPAFQGVPIPSVEIDGTHVLGYMNSDAVDTEIFNQFTSDF